MTLPVLLPGVATTVTPGAAPKCLGIDPSTSCTGLAGDGWADTIKVRPRRKHEDRVNYIHWRYDLILGALGDYLSGVELAVIEGLAMSPKMDMDRQLAWLNRGIRHLLWKRGIPYAVVSPSGLKLYALGKGKRSDKQIVADEAEGRTVKDPVLDVVRGWFTWFDSNDDAADGCVLHAMGRDWLGVPVVTVPASHRVALDGVAWPERDDLLVVAA